MPSAAAPFYNPLILNDFAPNPFCWLLMMPDKAVVL
jgi:hypothetical protein